MVTLRKGSTGTDVTKLQTALNRAGYSLQVDGIFGTKTESAVKDYQTKNHLAVDGVVGVETWKALNNIKPDNNTLYNAFVTCLDAVADLPEYKQLEELLYG